MIITISPARQSETRGRAFRTWCFDNGFLASEVVGAVIVDTAARRIVVDRVLLEPSPGDLDFPELRRDADNHPLTERRELPLLVEPPHGLADGDGMAAVA